MIKGIGVDIIEINRIKRAIENSGQPFLNKIFTKREIEYCEKQKNPNQHFAGRFAAKEAILKAFGLSWNSVDWKTIEIISGLSGEPIVKLHTKMKQLQKRKKIKKIFCSISHFNKYALSFVICV